MIAMMMMINNYYLRCHEVGVAGNVLLLGTARYQYGAQCPVSVRLLALHGRYLMLRICNYDWAVMIVLLSACDY